jgi:alanyl-tRNA synthetase
MQKDFPSLKEREKEIIEILDIETEKFSDTLSKGRNLIKRILSEKNSIDVSELISLYDTHGLPPDVVKSIAADQGVEIEVPDNFDSMVAELHSHEEKEEKIKEENLDLPVSERLYYKDHYSKEFDAKVVWAEGSQVILDRTAFYPEGGGQPGDTGFLSYKGSKIKVVNVIKKGDSIIHEIDGKLSIDANVHGVIDWDRRYIIMKHHTGTHLVNGALRSLLGEHVWQAGSQLEVNNARFDFSHYKSISDREKNEIEKLANNFIDQAVSVEKRIMDRNSAEKKFGFRLYQGGVPPGNSIRVLNIPGIDVEACGGTHLNNTSEVENIKILKTERIQDGVNRIIFAAGKMADAHLEKQKNQYIEIVNELSSVYTIEQEGDVLQQLQEVSSIFSVPVSQIKKTIRRFKDEVNLKSKKDVKDLIEASCDLFNLWKKQQKGRKQVSKEEINKLISNAEKISGTDIKIVIGTSDSEGNAVAGAITSDDNFIAHIFDGNKIVSMASKNVDIDLRKIAPEIGKILGGGGGGTAKMIQCGGQNIDRIDEALKTAKRLTINEIKS